MGHREAFERFLANHPFTFDLDSLMSKELKDIDTKERPKSIYKYFPSGRTDFFVRPLLRFTEPMALNDCFEFSNRWSGFAPDNLVAAFADHICAAVTDLEKNKGLAIDLFVEMQAEKGFYYNQTEIATLAGRAISSANQNYIKAVFAAERNKVSCLVRSLLKEFESNLDALCLTIAQNQGILSLTDDPASPAMWSYYAENGKGFVVEFDSNHDFFKSPTGTSLLWPVNYKSDRDCLFFENPIATFLTKHVQFAAEREWRVVKSLDDCDECKEINGHKMHFCKVPIGLIKSIKFGFQSNRDVFPTEAAYIKALYDPSVRIELAFANRRTGQIEFDELVL